MQKTKAPAPRRAYPTLRERGFYMTEDDLQGMKDRALGVRTRAAGVLHAAKTRLEEATKNMEDTASDLRNGFDVSLDAIPWLVPGHLAKLVSDIDLAEKELATAADEAEKLGASV